MVHYFSPLPRLDAIFKYIGPNMYKLKVTKPEVERVYRFWEINKSLERGGIWPPPMVNRVKAIETYNQEQLPRTSY